MSAAMPDQTAVESHVDRGWRLSDELNPRRLLANLNAAVTLYLLTAILTLSIAALIYSGPLAAQLPHALGGVLIGSALLVAIVSCFGSYGGSIAPAEDASGVIVALAAAAAAAALAGASPDVRFATVNLLVVGTTLATAVMYLLVKAFGLGTLVRFIPHPVIGGFLAGTGWLLVVGGIGVATDVPLGAGLLEPHTLARWLPSLALGAVMLLVMKHWRKPALLAGLCALGLVVFYAVTRAFGMTPAELADDGWLLGPFPDEVNWRFVFDPRTLAAVDWDVLASVVPVAAPAVFIAAIALLLNTSAVELITKRDLSLDRELLAHGAGNFASGLAGGLIGYTAISLSTLGHTLARGSRLPGVLVALLLAMTALLGTSLVSSIPRPVMAGLIIYVGLALLHEWVVAARRTLPRSDYAVVLMILAVIAIQNFLWGVVFGLLVTTLLFIVNYSRIGVVRLETSGDVMRSRVNRGPRERDRLQVEGGRLLIFKLRGYIFFGTASGLLDRVRRRLAAARGRRYVLIDFEQVHGFDSTALMSFGRLAQYAAEHGVELAFCGLDARATEQIRRDADLATLRCFADLDRGIEWCEERLLEQTDDADAVGRGGLREQLLALLPDAARIDAFLAGTTRRELRAGEWLMRAGDESDALFLVESGQFAAQLPRAEGREAVRLQTMHEGSTIGELGFLLGARRSADVVAERDSTVRMLDRPTWREIIEHEPDIARTLDTLAIRLLGERVVQLTRVVDALQR